MRIQKFISKNGVNYRAISKLEGAYFWHNFFYVSVSSNTSEENDKNCFPPKKLRDFITSCKKIVNGVMDQNYLSHLFDHEFRWKTAERAEAESSAGVVF